MAEDASRASSPEPGEAAPRGRIVQLNSRSSMDRQSLEAGRSAQPSPWRGSPPRSRFPRPYTGGYMKRERTSYDHPRERVFSRSRGRSVSRSPSRASQRARSRSRSPSPPKSPRSRSRSRSFSPRGHRTFSNWERGRGAGQYASGRGGRGFDSRQRARERDSWPRGGGRGGRYATYQRGNRFYPKEVRYKQAAPMPPRRSISRDRSEGGASFRDRQMRDHREYEPAYRGRPREREMGHRSTSLVRTASFSSDYYRDSEPSASAEEGEEKPEEFHATTSERSVDSHTPSEAGSTDRDMTGAADGSSKRTAVATLPPRSTTGDSYVSSRKEASSPIARNYDGDRSPVAKRELASESSSKIALDEAPEQLARSSLPSESIEERDVKRRTPPADANDTPKENIPAESTDIPMSPKGIADDGDQSKLSSLTATTASVKAEEAHEMPKQTTGVTKSSDGADKAVSKEEETRNEVTDDVDKAETQDTNAKSSEAPVKRESEVPSPKENRSSVDQRAPSSPRSKSDVSCKMVTSDFTVPPCEEKEELATKEPERGCADPQKDSTQDNDVDMDSGSSEKRMDVDYSTSARRRAATAGAEIESVGDNGTGQETSHIESVVLSRQAQHEPSSVFAKTEEVKAKDISSSLMPDNREVEEGEMVASSSEPDSGKEDAMMADSSVHGAKEGRTAGSPSISSEPRQEGKRAVYVVKASDPPERGNGREKRAKLERSRTDPSTDAYQDNNKPRSTSFSSFGLPHSSRHEGGSSEIKALSRPEANFSMASTRGEERGVPLKQHDASSTADPQQHGGRPALDRRASFSTLSERGHYSSSEARLAVGTIESAGGSRTARATSSFTTKSSPPKPYAVFENNAEGRRRGLYDELKKEDAVKRELLRAGSMDSIISKRASMGERIQGFKESPASASNSLTPRSVSGVHNAQPPREELPVLPDIPLPPSGVARGNSSPVVLGDGTPTKRLRPRLGWGQGLVASSPPQPAKRPRIWWGQGLIQQKDDTPHEKEDTTSAVLEGDTSVGAISASPAKTGEASVANNSEGSSVIKSEASGSESVAAVDCSEKEVLPAEEIVPVTSTPEKENQSAPLFAPSTPVEGSQVTANNEAENNADTKMEDCVGMEQDAVASAKPSKEEILTTIDTLDSDIVGVKKQIKALQRTIAGAGVKQDSSSAVTDMEIESADESDPSAVTTAVTETGVKVSPNSPTDASKLVSDQSMLTSPVKVAVDSRFVELLAGVFSENLRKTTAANEQLPKRMEQGQLATKIYHQPSDYAFYQANIDRGSALSDQVRLKVRKRNRARHEYMKTLAREYVDLKKSWKTGVKKMEKDRKRQDKLRLKQLQKQRLKSMGETGPIRTTNTNHQSPHVQVLVAAEKAAEAAGGEGAVRTSSRLTNNSSADLDNNDLEKIEQAKAQALIDQEVRKKRLKNALSTIIPDMLITPAERQQRYFTRFVNGQSSMADGLVTDWKLKEKAEMKVNPWNDLEKCIYMDKFLQFPKNFPRISSFLSNKTTGDVIVFYYRTKKVADYKALLREQQLRRRGAGSKNTWSCWNLSACAAICLGVQFPEHVAKLLLHPSNFRSHQASDNILNSAGAQRLLRTSRMKAEGGSTATKSTGTAESMSALGLVSGSDHTPTVRPSASEVGVQLDNIINSGDSDTSDEEKFNLYTQKLEQFIAGQQRPFLVDYASLLSDNSYSTGYEVSTLSIEERLKKYPTPSKELESAIAAATSGTSSGAAQGKQQGNAAGSNGNVKNGGPHMTKKEMKQQRKLKKMHEGIGGAAGSPTSIQATSQPGGNAGGERTGNHGRKKSSVGFPSNPSAMPGNRNTPRVSIPGDEKASQSGKKTSRGGAGTPGSRRNSHHPQTSITNASPKPGAMPSSATSTATVSIAAPAKKGAGGSITPNATARTSSPSAAIGGGGSNAAAPTKRVVQKWTDGEKADFLKFFSQYGKDWATLTENIPTKTAAQIKNYYQNYKNRLNLQDILKRRIENAAAGGGAKGAAHTTAASAVASGNMAASPRSAAAGLMSGSLRQMGRPVDLPGGLSMGMPSGSMAMNASDNISFQAALSAAQPGMHGVNVLSELSANQFGMQTHPDQQQQQSREMMNSNPERYLKLLNMQHQLQIMQFQQQQKPQGVGSENGGAGSSNSPYHEGQMNAPNAQRLFQFSHQQQQHPVPQQHMSLQALQQMGLQAHSQTPTHSQMMQHSMQQQQTRGSFADMGHPSGLYQSMGQMQTQHPQAMATAAQMGMSPTSAQQYDRPVDTNANASTAGGIAGSSSNLMGRHDASQRAMMNTGMMNNAAGGNGSTMAQAASSSPRQPPMGPPRSMAMEMIRPHEADSRQTTWRSSPVPPATSASSGVNAKTEDSAANSALPAAQNNKPKGREALAPPAPPPVQPVRSRMSFSSILNESESPRDDATPRGNGSMVIRQQESPRISQHQQNEQQQRELEQQQREQQQREQQQQLQQRQTSQLHLEHARAMPPSSAAELARSPVSAPSPTAHLLPRRSSVPTPQNRMGLMSSLLNVPSPERRTSTPGHQSPLMQQQMQRQMQAGRYYDATASSADSGTTSSRSSIATMVSGIPASSTMSVAMTRSSPSEKMASASSIGSYTSTSAQMAVALSRSGSASSTSSAVSASTVPSGDSRGQQLQQQQMWNYAPQMRYEEAELLRRAQIAEEEAARAKAAAVAAAQALQEAQKARQQALDMAANMARYNSAMQQQQVQQQTQQQQVQQQQQQQQPQQAQQYHQLQQYQQQLQAHQQQQMQQQQQHDYHQQHQAQQLHQQHMQHQALHHHLQLIQHQQQQQQRSAMSPSEHLLQQQLHQQQQPPRGPQPDRER
ncbi:hypothetical protein KRP22_009267 [Phytophthora ramorum]|nr:Nuclear receptor corepressor 2 [Phytophthora ramorum]